MLKSVKNIHSTKDPNGRGEGTCQKHKGRRGKGVECVGGGMAMKGRKFVCWRLWEEGRNEGQGGVDGREREGEEEVWEEKDKGLRESIGVKGRWEERMDGGRRCKRKWRSCGKVERGMYHSHSLSLCFSSTYSPSRQGLREGGR